MRAVVGVDFDNTLVDYTQVINEMASQLDFVSYTCTKTKSQIRDLIRLLPDGEVKWQRLQAELYGTEISRAVPSSGVRAFLIDCKNMGAKTYIVSHKTRFASQDNSNVDLRGAALTWLKKNHFFVEEETGINDSMVFFEDSRLEKLRRIRSLEITHFIDDLIETFSDSAFPTGVKKILYEPEQTNSEAPDMTVVRSWDSVRSLVLHADRTQ